MPQPLLTATPAGSDGRGDAGMSQVEPRPVPLSEFPDSTAKAPGMRVIEADLTPRYGTALLGVPYAEKSGRKLHGSDHGGPPSWQPEVMDIVDRFLRRHLSGSSVAAPDRVSLLLC
jgi:hypothetical protein